MAASIVSVDNNVNENQKAAASTEAEKVRQEKEALDSVTKKFEHVDFSCIIKLNVGGQIFTTSLQTLTKDANSMLHAMFSGRFDTKPAEDGSYFIDRDGAHFSYILNYLRTGKLLLPADNLVREQVFEEAKFYQVQGIIDELKQLHKTHEKKPAKHLTMSILYGDSDILSLSQCICLTAIHGDTKFNKSVLLYRGSRDGWQAKPFHSKCDSFNGPTMVVMESEKGFIFGGYTEKSWAGNGFKKDRAAFLFAMGNDTDVAGHVLKLKAVITPGKAIECGYRIGPCFGNQDLVTVSSNLYNLNSVKYGSTNVGHTFQVPQGHSGETVLAGEKSFTLYELEVYGLLQT